MAVGSKMKLHWHERFLIMSLKALGGCSLKTLYRLAWSLDQCLRPFALKFKKTIATNLARCFPDLPPDAQARLQREAEFHTFMRMFEMPFFWFHPKMTALPLQTFNEEAFEQDVAKGKGVIVLVPHLGCWELVNAHIAPRFPSVSLYKPAKKAYQEVLVREARERYGTEMLPTNIAGVKHLVRALKAGKCAGILADHDPGANGGVMAPFFGIPANTSTLVTKLAQTSGAAVYFALPERLPRGEGFHLHYLKAPENIFDPDLISAATAMNDMIATLIKRCPAQYEWSYKRFRRTPWQGQLFYE